MSAGRTCHGTRALETHDAFHSVEIMPGAAVIRVRTGKDHFSNTCREASTASTLAAAGLRVPAAIGEAVGTAQWTAHRFRRHGIGAEVRSGRTSCSD